MHSKLQPRGTLASYRYVVDLVVVNAEENTVATQTNYALLEGNAVTMSGGSGVGGGSGDGDGDGDGGLGGSSPDGNSNNNEDTDDNNLNRSGSPPHLNEYLAGSPFRGLARSASDVGLGMGGNNDVGGARSSAGGGGGGGGGGDTEDGGVEYDVFRRASGGGEAAAAAAAAVDESLLVSPILADYFGGSGSGSGGGANGKKSRPRTSQSPGGTAAAAAEGTAAKLLEDVAEEEQGQEEGAGSNSVSAADLAAAVDVAAPHPPELVNLGAQLQLDTSMCPSLGLGSVASDDEDDDGEDGTGSIGDVGGDALETVPESIGGAFEADVPESIGMFEADSTAADKEDEAEVEKVDEDTISSSKVDPEGATDQLDVTEETSPIQSNDDLGGNNESGETTDTSMNYSADSCVAGLPGGVGPEEAAIATEEHQVEDDDVNPSASRTSNPAEVPLQLENSIAKEEPAVEEEDRCGTTSSSTSAAPDESIGSEDMGTSSMDPPAFEDPLKCSLSPIARNSSSSSSSSPVLTRSPKVEGGLDGDVDTSRGAGIVQKEAPMQKPVVMQKAAADDEPRQSLDDGNASTQSKSPSPPRKMPAEENQALSMSARKIGKETLAACSNALLFVGEQVHQVVEAAVGTSEDVLPNTDADTDTRPMAGAGHAGVDEPINEEKIFSHMHPSASVDTPSPPTNVKSLTFAPTEYDIQPQQVNPNESTLLAPSAASNDDSLNALLSPPATYPSTDSLADPSHTSDLSSAKKKLGASSHALVERLRGAAQKRKLLVTRSRDSFVAKEQKQKQSLENLTSHTEEEEEVYEPEAPEPIRPTVQKRHFEGINPVREFKARPLPATTGDLGGGGQAGVPKVSKRPSTVPSSPLLGNRRRLKEGGVGESKAYQKVKEEERRRMEMTKEASSRKLSVSNAASKKPPSTDTPHVPFKARPLPATTGDLGHGGQTGVPKVAKRSPTIPSSPLLGHRRPTGNSQPSKAYQAIAQESKMPKSASSRPMTKVAPTVKPSALRAQPFDRLLSGSDASRAKESALTEKREREEAEARRKSSFRARPLPATTVTTSGRNHSPGLVGLDLLSSYQKRSSEKESYPYPGEENLTPTNERPSSAESPPKKQRIGSALPDRLHSTKRAKERAQYEEIRLSHDMERQQREMEERSRIIRETSEELDELRDQL